MNESRTSSSSFPCSCTGGPADACGLLDGGHKRRLDTIFRKCDMWNWGDEGEGDDFVDEVERCFSREKRIWRADIWEGRRVRMHDAMLE